MCKEKIIKPKLLTRESAYLDVYTCSLKVHWLFNPDFSFMKNRVQFFCPFDRFYKFLSVSPTECFINYSPRPLPSASVLIHCLSIILPHTLWTTGSTPGSPWYLCYRQLSVTPLPHVIVITKDLAVKITGIWNACEVLWEDKWTLVCIIGSNDTHCSVIHDTQGEEKYHVMINQSINQSITSAGRRI